MSVSVSRVCLCPVQASPVLNLSEDIFAGFNVLMRGLAADDWRQGIGQVPMKRRQVISSEKCTTRLRFTLITG